MLNISIQTEELNHLICSTGVEITVSNFHWVAMHLKQKNKLHTSHHECLYILDVAMNLQLNFCRDLDSVPGSQNCLLPSTETWLLKLKYRIQQCGHVLIFIQHCRLQDSSDLKVPCGVSLYTNKVMFSISFIHHNTLCVSPRSSMCESISFLIKHLQSRFLKYLNPAWFTFMNF